MAKAKEKKLTRAQKEELLAAMLKALPDAKEQSVQAVTTAMMTGYNLGRQSVQTA